MTNQASLSEKRKCVALWQLRYVLLLAFEFSQIIIVEQSQVLTATHRKFSLYMAAHDRKSEMTYTIYIPNK